MRNVLAVMAVTLAMTLATQGQMGAANPARKDSPAWEQANQLYAAKDWKAAAQAFESITRAEQGNALAWLRLGVSRHKLEQYAEAVAAYKHIEDDPQLGPSAAYREAASLTKMNRKDEAIAFLNKAVNAGVAPPAALQQDPDFTSLHGDEAFTKLLARADTIAHPCAHQPEYRQFDFCLANGTWSRPKAMLRPAPAAFNSSWINAWSWKTGPAVLPGKVSITTTHD